MTTEYRRRRWLLAAGLALVVAVACDAPKMTVSDPRDWGGSGEPNPGYEPLGIVPFIYHWHAGHEIAIYVDRTDEPSNANLATAVDDAITAWENIALLGEIKLRVVSDVHKADVIFHHYRAQRLVSSDICPPFGTGAGGQTFFCVTEDLQAVPLDLVDGGSSHVMMDVAINSFALDTVSFFPALVAHEMGHVLGIGAHSPVPTDLMYGRPRIFAPSPADITTLRYVLTRKPEVSF